MPVDSTSTGCDRCSIFFTLTDGDSIRKTSVHAAFTIDVQEQEVQCFGHRTFGSPKLPVATTTPRNPVKICNRRSVLPVPDSRFPVPVSISVPTTFADAGSRPRLLEEANGTMQDRTSGASPSDVSPDTNW